MTTPEYRREHTQEEAAASGWRPESDSFEVDDDRHRALHYQTTAGAEDPEEPETELNRMISSIGFGRYHRRVLALCGLGWLADNMWMQCVACILPRVQQHFAVSNARIGLLSSSMFLGLMCGALIWGPVSDRFGRVVAYRWTLAVAALFGGLASLAPSFALLCLCLFGLGSGVGGNMPVDGAIFLEFIPREKRHLLTLLSVFFSFGSALAASAALAILPPLSCPDGSGADCDVARENRGWRVLLGVLAAVTVCMVVLRNGCFRLHETPRFLLQNRRRADVVVVLRKIVDYNGGASRPTPLAGEEGSGERDSADSASDSSSWLEWPDAEAAEDDDPQHTESVRLKKTWLAACRQSVGAALDVRAHTRLLQPLFARALRRTTITVWMIWAIVAMGFTMFNVFLPKLLESSGNHDSQGETEPQGSHAIQVRVYRDSLVYAISGIPGSIVGAWLVRTRLGRIYSMALSTFVSGLALVAFAMAAKYGSPALTTVSSSVFGLMSTMMFAVIYAYTPEVFPAAVRGTACGMASALGRVSGIIAPLVTGLLLEASTTVPLYVSVGLLWAAAVCMVALPIETRDTAG
ncbi:hypothetical protein GGI07_000282 [Coemansia sp. Benny D115]|nr:hypothetical protein GGI07_000282 [Coemansia sp. Benny D115]